MSRIRVKVSRTVEFDINPWHYPASATAEDILACEHTVFEEEPTFIFELSADVVTIVEDIVEATYVEEKSE